LSARGVRARKQDELRDLVGLDVLEQLLEHLQVPGMGFGRLDARVVHHAQVDQRTHAVPEYVARSLAAHVELVVFDVRRLVVEGPLIHAHDRALTVQEPEQTLAQPAADPGHDHGAVLDRALHEQAAGTQKKTLLRWLRPRRSMCEMLCLTR
jgi:hypothetical protein